MAKRKQKQETKRLVLADNLTGQGTLGFNVDNMVSPQSRNKSLADIIQDNLRHTLRPYQWQAINNFNWCFTHDNIPSYSSNDKPVRMPNQLMFKMATGSGKTDIMAALILYLYVKGYRYFVYITESKGVVEKTKDNFLDRASEKYLFNPKHSINIGSNIAVEGHLPDSLNDPAQQTIYIQPMTIGKLMTQAKYGGDNQRSLDDFYRHPIVILADEAHHFNRSTKQTKKQKQNGSTWEEALNQLRHEDPRNLQLEFTATLDYQHDDHLYEKYRDKIVYEYGLKQFVNTHDDPRINGGVGYAKTIRRLQTPDDDGIKMRNAILLSQYRVEIARKAGIPHFKPIILMKSKRVQASHNARNKFVQTIRNLKTRSLMKEIRKNIGTVHSVVLRDYVYRYWLNRLQNDLSHDEHTVVDEIQQAFAPGKVIDMNDNSRKGILSDTDNFTKVNSLEDPNNPIRVIFAVAKLTEGWDVLNLYDIVRLKEKSKTVSKKETNSEAQLIGRGSRYYPFHYRGKTKFHRRFDRVGIKMQLLERLYYHTINDDRYIYKLNQALERNNVPLTDDEDYKLEKAHLKKGFRRSHVYQYGRLYHNVTVEREPDSMKSFADCGIQTGIRTIDIHNGTFEQRMTDESDAEQASDLDVRNVLGKPEAKLSDDPQLVRTAMNYLYPFFNFHTLHHYLEPLKSLLEFMISPNWLGGIELDAKVDHGSQDFKAEQRKVDYVDYRHTQLRAVIHFFRNQLIPDIRNARTYRKGTDHFVGMHIKGTVPIAYEREIKRHQDKDAEHPEQHISAHDMTDDGEGWFVYDKAIVNELEFRCIQDIGDQLIKPLQQVGYKNIYLIRNDEQNMQLTLHSFTDKQHPQGYMPDFILYMTKPNVDSRNDYRNIVYQIYIEPKGNQLLERDAWKQDLLQSIRPSNIEPQPIKVKNLSTNNKTDKVNLFGVKFYTGGFQSKRDSREMIPQIKHLLHVRPNHNKHGSYGQQGLWY